MRIEQIDDLVASEYHKIEALSASGAKTLLRSPAHYIAAKETFKEPTPAMRLGTAVHTMILEPEKFEAEIAVMPKFDKRTTIGKQAALEFEDENKDKCVIDYYQHERAKQIAEAVRDHEFFKAEVHGGKAEATLLWEAYGVQCKARLDYLKDQTIFDVKTCQDASPEGFSRQIASFKYHMQAAHYTRGFKRVHDARLDRFVFIAVESEYPHMVGIYVLNRDALWVGDKQMEQAAKAYRHVIDGNAERTYTKRVCEIGLPGWAMPENAFGS
jgi:exodeoxyribonuclease VIII